MSALCMVSAAMNGIRLTIDEFVFASAAPQAIEGFNAGHPPGKSPGRHDTGDARDRRLRKPVEEPARTRVRPLAPTSARPTEATACRCPPQAGKGSGGRYGEDQLSTRFFWKTPLMDEADAVQQRRRATTGGPPFPNTGRPRGRRRTLDFRHRAHPATASLTSLTGEIQVKPLQHNRP